MAGVTVAESIETIVTLRPLWQRLYRSGAYTQFQSFEWNLAAARVFERREQPYVVAVEAAAGAAIVPAAVRNSSQLVLLGEELFDYRTVLAAGSGEAQELAWSVIAELGLPFQVCAVRGEPSGCWQLFDKQYFCAAPFATADAPTYNQKLAREWRKLLRHGFELRVSDGNDQHTIRELYEKKALQEADCLFHDPLRIEMVCEMARSTQGIVDVFSLWKEGALASACLTFRDHGWRRIYGTFYDHRWRRFSPGVALMYFAAQDAFARGLNVDFMTGEQWYKGRIVDRRMPLYRLHATPETLRAIAAPVEVLAA
jgi:CelD/BcsL family acetyltransferase involved in cellulose biosynthesis